MNRQDYRAAFDAVAFSPDFEERTLQRLAAARQASEKEQNKMSMNRMKKTALLAAAAAALLAVTVSAAVAFHAGACSTWRKRTGAGHSAISVCIFWMR